MPWSQKSFNVCQLAKAYKETQAFAFKDQGEIFSLSLREGTITEMQLTITGPLTSQMRRFTFLTRLTGLSLSFPSASAWLLGN